MLYVMLVGAYPFERPEDKHDNQKLQKMIQVCAARRAAPCAVTPSIFLAYTCASVRGSRVCVCVCALAAHPQGGLSGSAAYKAVGGLPQPA